MKREQKRAEVAGQQSLLFEPTDPTDGLPARRREELVAVLMEMLIAAAADEVVEEGADDHEE